MHEEVDRRLPHTPSRRIAAASVPVRCEAAEYDDPLNGGGAPRLDSAERDITVGRNAAIRPDMRVGRRTNLVRGRWCHRVPPHFWIVPPLRSPEPPTHHFVP